MEAMIRAGRARCGAWLLRRLARAGAEFVGAVELKEVAVRVEIQALWPKPCMVAMRAAFVEHIMVGIGAKIIGDHATAALK